MARGSGLGGHKRTGACRPQEKAWLARQGVRYSSTHLLAEGKAVVQWTVRWTVPTYCR